MITTGECYSLKQLEWIGHCLVPIIPLMEANGDLASERRCSLVVVRPHKIHQIPQSRRFLLDLVKAHILFRVIAVCLPLKISYCYTQLDLARALLIDLQDHNAAHTKNALFPKSLGLIELCVRPCLHVTIPVRVGPSTTTKRKTLIFPISCQHRAELNSQHSSHAQTIEGHQRPLGRGARPSRMPLKPTWHCIQVLPASG